MVLYLKKKKLGFIILASLCSIAPCYLYGSYGPYAHCSDILRHGVFNTSDNGSKVDRQIAAHQSFCSMYKKHENNQDGYTQFAHEYAKTTKVSQGGSHAGGKVGYGPFSLGGSGGTSNLSDQSSAEEKENFLQKNRQTITDYYQQNCGDSSYEESIRAESFYITKVASSDIVNAWKLCMTNNASELAAFVTASPNTHDISIYVTWQAEHNLYLNKVGLNWNPAFLASLDHYKINENILPQSTALYHKGSLNLLFTREKENQANQAIMVTINGITNTSSNVSTMVEIPPMLQKEESKMLIENYRDRLCQALRMRAFMQNIADDEILKVAESRNMVPKLDDNGKLSQEWIKCNDFTF